MATQKHFEQQKKSHRMLTSMFHRWFRNWSIDDAPNQILVENFTVVSKEGHKPEQLIVVNSETDFKVFLPVTVVTVVTVVENG